MSFLRFARNAVYICASAAILNACAGAQSPSAFQRSVDSTQNYFAPGPSGGSWMMPKAKGEDLLYVAAGELSVFSFPSGKLVGVIEGSYLAEGICSNKAGDVFVVEPSYVQVVEYPHGSLTPSAIFTFGSHDPEYCAVDPSTGNLAVTTSGGGPYAGVAIFKGAKGQPKYYFASDQNVNFSSCAYNTSSALFVDGSNGGNLELSELAKGRDKFQTLKLSGSHTFRDPNPIQWDGRYITAGDQNYSSGFTIYRLRVKGDSASIVGSTLLDDNQAIEATWFQHGIVIGASPINASFWKYPAGGYPSLTLSYTGGSTGVAVSLAQTK